MEQLTTKQKSDLIYDGEKRREVTLNGEPAFISGRLLPYAVIHYANMPHISIDYSWQTVERIVNECNGEFQII